MRKMNILKITQLIIFEIMVALFSIYYALAGLFLGYGMFLLGLICLIMGWIYTMIFIELLYKYPTYTIFHKFLRKDIRGK